MSRMPAISQEMIDLYDEYTHLTLDRRGFMEKLARLAGSSAAAAAIVPLIASDYARAETVAADDPRLTTATVAYPGPAGAVSGYLAVAAATAGKRPAVIVIHENRGLNAHIKDVTRRVALEGFVALAPDLLSRMGGTPADEEKAAGMFRDLDRGAAVADAVAAIAYMRTHPASNGKVGAIGFCFGGGIVNQMAVASPELLAAVPYYGAQPSREDAAKIKARLMLHYAGLDERIDAGIAAYEAALTAAGVDYQVFIYPGVNHAFNNDTSVARYNKEAADLAWSRTIAFLKETLS